MIKENELFMKRLYNEFSARFCALDIKRVSEYDFSQNDVNSILFLPINENRRTNIPFLFENGYHLLIIDILKNCELTDSLKEASKPFVDEKTFFGIKEAFKIAQTLLTYVWKEDGLYISAPEMFVDIVLYPSSQFHSNVINAFEIFKNYIDVNGFPAKNIFLNSKSPSFFTQFSEFWIADKLAITRINNNKSSIVI